jgi:hypothetical protein
MEKQLSPEQFQNYKTSTGEPFRENLRASLKAFEDPREAIKAEVASIRALPFIPQSLILHGLLSELSSGSIEIIVNGYHS